MQADNLSWTDHFVEQIAHQGRRNTGGSWTRPDFVVIGIQKYEYTPGVVREVETFEVKLANCSIEAVFETAAHSRSATKSYLAIEVEDGLPKEQDLARIESECQRFGIGLVIFRQASNPYEWDFRVEASRREPDPALLEEFIEAQINNKNRGKLRRWLH